MKEQILSVIKDNPKGLTISGVSDKVPCSRITVRKYLPELVDENKIEIRKVGIAKLIQPVDKNED